MASGLATGWCERRAERDSTVLLVLCGEAEWGDGSSALLWAWGEGTSEAGPKDTGGPVPAHTQRLSASARPPPPPRSHLSKGSSSQGSPKRERGAAPMSARIRPRDGPAGLCTAGIQVPRAGLRSPSVRAMRQRAVISFCGRARLGCGGPQGTTSRIPEPQ